MELSGKGVFFFVGHIKFLILVRQKEMVKSLWT